MSSFYEKVKYLVEANDDDEKEELYKFYTETAVEKLENLKSCTHMALVLLNDLINHLKIHPFKCFKMIKHTTDQTFEYAIAFTNKHDDSFILNDDAVLINHLKSHVIHLKMLHLRAIILDLITTDYSSDSRQFYKPEKWIYEVTKNIEETLQDLMSIFIHDINEALLNEFKTIFLSKNKKFGYHGNLLVLNFVVYERWLRKNMSYDFDEFYNAFFENFIPGRRMEKEEIENLIDELSD